MNTVYYKYQWDKGKKIVIKYIKHVVGSHGVVIHTNSNTITIVKESTIVNYYLDDSLIYPFPEYRMRKRLIGYRSDPDKTTKSTSEKLFTYWRNQVLIYHIDKAKDDNNPDRGYYYQILAQELLIV